jgi:threonine dehydrogenase-like Zn-dependent dehydrogenase
MEPQMIEAVIERTSVALDPSRRTGSAYGIGRLVGRGLSTTGSNGARVVLVKLEDPAQSEVLLNESQCVAVPPTVEASAALLAPPLGLALWMWDRLRLELGELAVYTDGDAFAPLVGQVALWRGGCPVVRLSAGVDHASRAGIDSLSMSDPEAAARELRNRINANPGFAAIDLSGRPEIIDLLFEVMPRWGRMMLAGGTREPLTIDFYNNVHRKGMLLLTGLFDPTRVFQEEWGSAYLRTAFRILQNTEMASICAHLIEGQSPRRA